VGASRATTVIPHRRYRGDHGGYDHDGDQDNEQSGLTKLTIEWSAEPGSGSAPVTGSTIDGKIVGLYSVPADLPQATYSVAIKGLDGHDVLLGQGASLSGTANAYINGYLVRRSR